MVLKRDVYRKQKIKNKKKLIPFKQLYARLFLQDI